jgi:phytoene desaturase (3,4-didehydrolycopene-forming)
MVNIGERNGVKYRLNTSISQIQMSDDGQRATGVVLEDSKETLSADMVICNADLIYAYNNLLPQTSYARSLAKREASCSSISFYWALDKQFPELTAHNIFLAEDYKESFDSIFKKHQIPEEPSFYVNVPTRVDPSAAPKGCDSIVVLVPVGHLLESASDSHRGTPSMAGTSQDWDTMVSVARETILKTIESRLNIKLASHIIHESINTPPSWKSIFNLDRGAILGLSHSFFNVLSFRPKTKHPNIDNLYFVGASTHPGTGVPIVFAGAKIVSEQVLKAINKRIPWAKSDQTSSKSRSALDKAQTMPILSSIHWAIIAFIAALISILNTSLGGFNWRESKFVGDW